MSRYIRIAVASRDGKFVNEHFGRAERFFIAELDMQNHDWKYLEERTAAKCCHSGEHEESAFTAVSRILADCQAIVISKIGYGASAYMESAGFELFEAGMPIEDALQKLDKYYTEKRGETNGSFI